MVYSSSRDPKSQKQMSSGSHLDHVTGEDNTKSVTSKEKKFFRGTQEAALYKERMKAHRMMSPRRGREKRVAAHREGQE